MTRGTISRSQKEKGNRRQKYIYPNLMKIKNPEKLNKLQAGYTQRNHIQTHHNQISENQ